MARQTVDAAAKLLTELDGVSVHRASTRERPLPGAAGLDQPDLEGVAAVGRALMREHHLDLDTATHLCGVYGARAPQVAALIDRDPALGKRIDPELAYVWAEVEFAARHDLARTVDDVLARRVPLLLVSRDQGLSACKRVASMLAAIHGWTTEHSDQMIDEYRAEVALSRRWRF
jgi:glycerol-3-phosphate dehydrogenase